MQFLIASSAQKTPLYAFVCVCLCVSCMLMHSRLMQIESRWSILLPASKAGFVRCRATRCRCVHSDFATSLGAQNEPYFPIELFVDASKL